MKLRHAHVRARKTLEAGFPKPISSVSEGVSGSTAGAPTVTRSGMGQSKRISLESTELAESDSEDQFPAAFSPASRSIRGLKRCIVVRNPRRP